MGNIKPNDKIIAEKAILIGISTPSVSPERVMEYLDELAFSCFPHFFGTPI